MYTLSAPTAELQCRPKTPSMDSMGMKYHLDGLLRRPWSFGGALRTCLPGPRLFRDRRANMASCNDSSEPHPPSSMPTVATPPMRRLHQTRCRLSSNRESVACRRMQVSPKLAESSLLGMVDRKNDGRGYSITDNGISDGIARVYGMSNVQAEELVEYVTSICLSAKHTTNSPQGSPPASRACA